MVIVLENGFRLIFLKIDFFAAILLEQQIVFFCPNLGLLSTAVMSLIPLIRPFAWQSLLMPVLPAQENMLNLLDAPVPFIMGVQVNLFTSVIP